MPGHKSLLLLFFVFFFGEMMPAGALTDITLHTITHDGLERSYHLYIPESADPDVAMPLLIALHPIASSGLGFAAMTDFNATADEYGFAVVYPNSARLYWDDGRVDAGVPPDDGTVDDPGFIAALLDDLIANHTIDPQRVYLTGTDNGGGLALHLACEMSQRFAAVAVYGILLWDYHYEACAAAEAEAAINVLVINGVEDVYYPAAGRALEGQDRSTMQVPPIGQTLSFFAERNACAPDMINDFRVRSDGLLVANYVTFGGCSDETTVAGVIVSNAGHNWPHNDDGYLLNPSLLDVTEMMALFFTGSDEWTTGAIFTTGVDRTDDPPLMETTRNYRLYVPTTYTPDTPMPLVMVLHGRPSNGVDMASITDMNTVAEREGFIAVYPDGINLGWSLETSDVYSQVDDVQFIPNIIADLSVSLNIDQQRLYLTGFSNGGFMTQYMACLIPDQFAAYAFVGASVFPGLEEACAGTDAVPALMMNGTEDVSIPWEGQFESGPAGISITLPIPESLLFWVEHNGCNTESDTRVDFEQSDEATRVGLFPFSNCDDGSTLLFYGIEGGGHNWPGVPGRIPDEIAGNVSMDINASEVIWEFFQQYTRDVE